MKRNERNYCLICGYYYVGLAQDCKCTGDDSGGQHPYDEPLTETLMGCVIRWLKVERTITRWEYWLMGIGSGTCAAALTNLLHWLGS